QFAELPRRHERHLPAEREPGAEYEAARLDRHHGLGSLDAVRHLPDRLSQRARVGQQRGDVLEEDALARKVGDVSDPGAQIDHQWIVVRVARSISWYSSARRSLPSARDSIWRTRSREMPKCAPV